LKPPVGDLAEGGAGLPDVLDPELAPYPRRAFELDVAVADDLEAVAPRVAEVEALAAAAEHPQALAGDRRPRSVDVVDDEAEMAAVVRRLRPALRDGEELVEEPFRRLIEEGQLAGYRHDGFWLPMDTFKDKQLLEDMYSRGKAPWEVWKNAPESGPAGESAPTLVQLSLERSIS